MPKVPDEMWKCPECGSGFDNGNGLTGPDYTTWEEAVAAYGKEDAGPKDEYGICECGACGWGGHVKAVYKAAQKKAGRKPCPHCKGTGWVDGEEG